MSRRTIAVYAKAGKLTLRGLAHILRAAGRQIRKAHRSHQTPHGKQTVRQLMGHGEATSSIPVEAPALFDQVARRWKVDYAFYQQEPGKYLLFFKSKQADAITACMSDYDKPVDEEGEQYETYFLSQVDESDLLAALEASGGELPACTCTEKCAAGAVNTDCPVCATNMTECAGVAPEPEPAEPEEPEEAQEPEAGFPAGTLLLALAAVVIGGGAGWYFKIYRPKQERAEAQAQEDYPDEADPYDDPDGDYDPYGGEDDPEDEETEGRS